MKKLISILVFSAIILSITQSAQSAVTIVDLLGDKDGFGIGVPIANGLHYTDYGMLLNDHRDFGDPDFTDCWLDGDQAWEHTLDLTGITPASATLEIYVACMVDNPAWSADVFVNGVNVGTIPPETSDYDITRILTFDIPVGLLASSVGIIIDLNNELDGYTIDYSQLTIQSIPAPGALALCGIGTALLGWLRKTRTL